MLGPIKDLAICPSESLTDEKLKEEYSINQLTDKEIALKYNIGSKATVWRRRRKLGIENLNKNKSNKNAAKNRVFNIF